MIELKYISGPHGDECSDYTVHCPEMTVRAFIDEILKTRSNEWGVFRWGSVIIATYKDGELFVVDNLNAYADRIVIPGTKANGGWSRMDYNFELKTPEPQFIDFSDTPIVRWIRDNYKSYAMDWTYERSEGNYIDCFEDGYTAGLAAAAYDVAHILGIPIEEPAAANSDDEYEEEYEVE